MCHAESNVCDYMARTPFERLHALQVPASWPPKHTSSRARRGPGRWRCGGSSGEHAIKIIERDVAGASSGEAYQARTRSGGGAQLQEEGQKVYPFADWEQGARAPRKTPRPDPLWYCSDAEAPACAPHPAAPAGCPPPVGGGARREGGPGPRRARFRRRLSFCANFFCCGGCIGSSAFVYCCWRGLGVRTAPSPCVAACPHAKT